MAGKQVTYVLNLKSNIPGELNKASGSVKNFENKVGSAGQKAQSTFGGMAKFAGLATLAMGAFEVGKSIVTMASDVENSKVAFEVLLGSAAKATSMLADMKKFADSTPFTFTDLQQAGKTMLGFQIPANQVMKTLKNLGDVSMGDPEKLKSMTLAFSQMSATGKLMGQDLNQMINAGFNPLGEMARKSGKSVGYFKDQMAKGAISSEMVAEAFESATAKGGPFFGMMERMSKTTAGRFSTLKDQIQTVGIAIGTAILPYLNKLMEGVSAFFSKLGEIRAILQPLIDIFVTTFSGIYTSLVTAFSGVDVSLNGLMNGIKTLVEWITPLYQGIGEFVGAVVSAVIEIIKPLFSVFKLIMGYFHVLFVVVKNVLKGLMIALKPVITVLTAIATVIGWISELVMGAWKVLTTLVQKFMEFEWVKTLLNTIVTVVSTIGDALQAVYDNTIGPIVEAIKSAYGWFKNILGLKSSIPLKGKEKESFEKTQSIVTANMNKKSMAFTAATPEQNAIPSGTSKVAGTKLKTTTSPNSVKSNSPNNINISIKSLIEEFKVNTTTLKEGSFEIKDIVAKVLLEAVNDVNFAR